MLYLAQPKGIKMKKLFFALLAFATIPAAADYYRTQTSNCNPYAMHETLDRAVRSHRAVITEVTCDSVAVISEPVHVAPAPLPVYQPVYEPVVDYSYIPVVDCVPGPTVQEYCGGCR